MIRTIGMIGAGNMGSAILRGIVEAEYVRASQIVAYDTNRKRMRELEEDLPGVAAASDCLEVAERADLIILAVKPVFVKEVIDEIRRALQGKAVLSIAAGWTVSMLEKALQNSGATYMRVMPNTPALVGEGMTALCDESTFSKEDFEYSIFEKMFASPTDNLNLEKLKKNYNSEISDNINAFYQQLSDVFQSAKLFFSHLLFKELTPKRIL